MPSSADVAETLRQEHEQIRDRLRAAMNESAAIAAAARGLSQLCVPHFELEERIVFPILERLHGRPAAKLTDIHEQASELGRQRKRFGRDHEAIVCAAHVLFVAAHEQGKSELAELADMIAHHERFEDDLGMAVYDLGVARNLRS
jgi:hypothetical protein